MSTMLLFKEYFKRYGVRLPEHLKTPRTFALNKLSLSRNAMLHYLPESETETGPSSDDILLATISRQIYVDHVINLTSLNGSPRHTAVTANTLITDYRNRYRKLRPLKNLQMADREDLNLLVYNYAMLPHLYKYIRSFFTQYYTWYNIRATAWETIAKVAQQTERQHFIQVTLPTILPTINQLRATEKNRNRDNLENFRSGGAFDILDLWCWLGEERSKSLISKLPTATLDRTNIIFRHLGRWMVINLGVLNRWRTDPELKNKLDENKRPIKNGAIPPDVMQVRILKMLNVFFESATISEVAGTPEQPVVDGEVVESGEDPSDVEIKQQLDELGEIVDQGTLDELNELDDVERENIEEAYDEDGNMISAEKPMVVVPQAVGGTPTKNRTHESAILAKADQLADSGMVTGGEYRRLIKLSTAYKSLKNPYGEGTFEEGMTIKPEDLLITKVDTLPDAPQILDKSMLQSTVEDLDRQYIEKVFNKDILSSVMMVQQAGIAVTGYDVERVVDAVSDYEIHTVTLNPAVGRQSTVRFRIPKVYPNGTYVSNGVKYRLKKQRADLPIRKVSPDRVGLSSYYAKIFVDRSDRATFNYERWLSSQIVAKGLDANDTTITNIRVSNVEDTSLKVPGVYSIISTRVAGFESGGITYWFDYKNRVGLGPFVEADLRLERKSLVLVGKGEGKYILMDKNNVFYSSTGNGDLDVFGRVEEIFDLPAERAPTQVAELKVFSKAIPIGVVLGYLLGFDNLLKLLKVTPRVVPNGERLNMAADEYALRFLDESLIFSRDDAKATMILAGFNLYKNLLRNYSTHTFNKKDIYLNLLEGYGIGMRYLRELDLMDAMFVDPITKGILEWMKEPTDFTSLLIRAVQLLESRFVPDKVEGASEMVEGLERARGYERIAGAVYSEMVKSIRVYNARTATSTATVSMNPHAVWTTIVQDPASEVVQEINPIHNLKEKEVITFGGTGGRSRRSMVANTRLYQKSDMGFISEATVDSGDVAIITYMSPNANFTSVRGTVRHLDPKEDGTSTMLSTAALLAPAADRDDPKRVNVSSFAS